MHLQNKKLECNSQIINIKGLSWMLKGNSTGTTTNSSHVSTMNQHFKIFKLKDQKKKWKKKSNKKFEGVGIQIQAILKTKASQPQPFNQNYLKIIKPQYVPHLQMIKKVVEQDEKQNRQANIQKQKIINEIKQQYKLGDLKTKQEMNDEIMKLTQSYQNIKNSAKKIQKIKNIGKIYEKKKQLFEETINQYFKEEEKQAVIKIQKYKQFNIQEYQNELIQANIQKCTAKNNQSIQNTQRDNILQQK